MSTIKVNQWLNLDGTENFKCRAWVNFNGTGTVAIRAAGNVTSITDNGTGEYTVNFTTAMPDANYSVFVTGMRNSTDASGSNPTTGCVAGNSTYSSSVTANGVRVKGKVAASDEDPLALFVGVFR